MQGKGVKYIIYLHWQRETNAFTVIEDTSPSHIDTHINVHTYFGLKNIGWKTESREKLIFLKQVGNRERNGESEAKEEDDGERRRKAVGGERGEEPVKRPK